MTSLQFFTEKKKKKFWLAIGEFNWVTLPLLLGSALGSQLFLDSLTYQLKKEKKKKLRVLKQFDGILNVS